MVSVCMAAYNGAKYIEQQIGSILAQLSATDELIICDDGSKDETVTIIKSFEDNRIILLQSPVNKGVIQAFETTLYKAKGDHIFLSDQDDIWLPEKVKVCLEQLRYFDLVTTDCVVVNDELQVVNASFFEMLRARRGILQNLKRNTYQGCCMCFTKKMLPTVLPFPKDIPMHDIWIGFVGDMLFKVKFEEAKLLLYRRHSSTATNTQVGHSKVPLKQKIAFRLNLIKYLPMVLIRSLRATKMNMPKLQ